MDERLPVVRGAAGSRGWVCHGFVSDRAHESGRENSLRRKGQRRGPEDGWRLLQRTSGRKIRRRISRDYAEPLPDEDKGR